MAEPPTKGKPESIFKGRKGDSDRSPGKTEPSGKKSDSSPSGDSDRASEASEPDHHGDMMKRHETERKGVIESHEKERRDMHGNQREEMRQMHARHEAMHKQLNAKHQAEMAQGATTAAA